jgi:hypothetical protein
MLKQIPRISFAASKTQKILDATMHSIRDLSGIMPLIQRISPWQPCAITRLEATLSEKCPAIA